MVSLARDELTPPLTGRTVRGPGSLALPSVASLRTGPQLRRFDDALLYAMCIFMVPHARPASTTFLPPAIPYQLVPSASKSQSLKKRPSRIPATAFSFIDLFAGVGGIRLPFQKLGGVCVFSSEWDKFSQLTYEANFGEKPHGDITAIHADDIPSHDILLGGFPCQAFSVAGHKRGFEDTRGTLFFEIARIAKRHRPKMLLLENVKGFLGHDRGRTFAVVRATLEELGYSVFHRVLNARDFGVPQNRERVYIVAIDRHSMGDIDFTFPNALMRPTRVGMILEHNVDPKYTLSDRLWQGHQRRLRQHRERGNGFGYSLFTPSSPYTSTISARYYKDGSEILIAQHNRNPRRLTPREAARLQGFPARFKIPVSDGQAYKQFGNSVAVPVVAAVAKAMIDLLLHPTKRKARPKNPQGVLDI
jgi:DNA (cytosine-5)-methyltransferase 1